MKILGIQQNINKNYSNIKIACRKKNMTIIELCKMLGITRQHLHHQVHINNLKKKYIEKIERILEVIYD